MGQSAQKNVGTVNGTVHPKEKRKEVHQVLSASLGSGLGFYFQFSGHEPIYCISLKIKKRHYEHHMIETHR
jgi:hypothetical protein